MKNKLIPAIILFFSFTFSTAASDSCLDRWEEFSHSAEKKELTVWMKDTASNILAKNKITNKLEVALPAQPDCTGLFITLIRKGKVRGCYGAFSHRYNSPSEILRDYIKGALFLDPRHEPLEKYEFDETEIVLTVASNPEPVDDINNVDISNFGLFIEYDDSTKTVIVPAEYRTASRVIKLTGNRPCRYYRFRAVTIK
ncbi:MAG TPA: AMMECR1 domain-containing protein [Spirochaetota bacterium]|nr:AMMECR1 domain-containing protein [Spirochaetota bacterium]HPS85226.1 AMMECR1 domain-containing protein [Spirochaetota bacterium]